MGLNEIQDLKSFQTNSYSLPPPKKKSLGKLRPEFQVRIPLYMKCKGENPALVERTKWFSLSCCSSHDSSSKHCITVWRGVTLTLFPFISFSEICLKLAMWSVGRGMGHHPNDSYANVVSDFAAKNSLAFRSFMYRLLYKNIYDCTLRIRFWSEPTTRARVPCSRWNSFSYLFRRLFLPLFEQVLHIFCHLSPIQHSL